MEHGRTRRRRRKGPPWSFSRSPTTLGQERQRGVTSDRTATGIKAIDGPDPWRSPREAAPRGLARWTRRDRTLASGSNSRGHGPRSAQRAVDRDLAMLEQTGRLEARTGAAPAQGRSSAPKGKGKATGSKTKAAASKGKGRASSGARGGSSATPVPDEEAMAKNRGAWDDAIEKLQALPTVRLAATASELERAAELAKWLIGHAYLRFAGPGAV
ncbi:hypothetical protein FRC08_010816, partial [Ceratobasidium sp. 394]